MKYKDLANLKIGPLLVLRRAGNSEKSGKTLHGTNALWECLCDCGTEVTKNSADLLRANRIPVGCSRECPLTRASVASKRTTHGLSKHKLYAIWRSMCDRCRLPSHRAWDNYGARGITVCDRWRDSFQKFWDDMSPTWEEGLTLDRINNNLGYSPDNTRWATYTQQARNTRRSVIPDAMFPLIREAGISRSTVYYRLARGWDMLRACSTPSAMKRSETC